ncbi:MAG: hypothetical protein RL701_6171 [Pseudomonadota bacterium]|jgi:hypothetical protein
MPPVLLYSLENADGGLASQALLYEVQTEVAMLHVSVSRLVYDEAIAIHGVRPVELTLSFPHETYVATHGTLSVAKENDRVRITAEDVLLESTQNESVMGPFSGEIAGVAHARCGLLLEDGNGAVPNALGGSANCRPDAD